ncbi:uncharacterized protein LOC129573502 isoform X2 [Sitodiplosis mosellana]|nr:uncharacterized protein LOC129573502 isoform X2 [Sitodiplosis mosellana]XP_055309995.1 uncharacterized protein LOC129573502 isoform X2 [Sitodiplosis mosellana]XP_055309996.1 uncharacterized protein LOC129573502 isoform X2 [Sitodiplosis mosellana]XP_055309997.1 uncharacterized protein LOC129573502 isoform X2 [Sitodiplosis mosellana]XP_055309998.1 uncharacterized protein LOC129573502 isoform X2 [Sitodiplosis mosellana]
MSAIYELVILLAILATIVESKGSQKVQCSEDLMKVDIVLSEENINPSDVYLEGLKGYPNPRCQPTIKDGVAQFQLPLRDFYECGVTRVVYKLNGKKVFYHKVIIETPTSKEFVSFKCITSVPYNLTKTPHNITRRDVLPVGFEEPIELDITPLQDYHAPIPILGVGVRQGGELVDGELNVSPGTPLSMEIYLDKNSAPVYGLGVTYMQVTDTKTQEETIIFNGCSVDPFLFENFNTVDGDFLTAKFRAFKFPDSTYVQFRGTVNACIDKCKGIPCSNGQIGYGRRKREIASQSAELEFSMSTLIRVVGEPVSKEIANDLDSKLEQLKATNQKLQRNSRGSVFQSIHDNESALIRRSSSSDIAEEPIQIRAQVENSAPKLFTIQITIVSLLFTFVRLA